MIRGGGWTPPGTDAAGRSKVATLGGTGVMGRAGGGRTAPPPPPRLVGTRAMGLGVLGRTTGGGGALGIMAAAAETGIGIEGAVGAEVVVAEPLVGEVRAEDRRGELACREDDS